MNTLFIIGMALMASACVKPMDNGGSKLNGSVVREECNLYGVIRDKESGQGIAGVAVSDGYTYCVTDKNGVYQIKANAKARTVNVVIPSEYKIPTENGHPAAYALLDRSTPKMLYNFTLEKLAEPQTEFTIIALGDQHLRNDSWAERFKNETLADVRRSLEAGQAEGRFKNAYIFALGDLMHYFSPEAYSLKDVEKIAVNQTVSTQDEPVIFFNCIGNHDHDQTVENYASDEDYLSAGPWINTFGPTDYAIDRGNVHIVVMDNVVAHGNSGDNGGAGKNVNCNGGFNINQINWLRQDFETVKDRKNKTLVFICHIPFLDGTPATSSSTSYVREDQGYAAVLTLMRQFGNVHIISGHIHTPLRYSHSKYLTAGGKPVYEHNLRSCCGQNWNARICSDGAPQGYSFFEFKNGKVESWHDKATDWEMDQAIRLYNGSERYSNSSWWVGNASNSSTWAGKLIASVPGADPSCWSLSLENGGSTTTMTAVSSAQTDWCSYSFWKTVSSSNEYKAAKMSYWTADMPSSSNWKVKARFTNPFSGKVTTYECSTLQSGFTGFAK